MELKLGKYKHYKGKFYQVNGFAKHSDTLEDMVIYQALYNSKRFGNNAIWVKPKKLFIQNVIIDGKKIPRFRYVG